MTPRREDVQRLCRVEESEEQRERRAHLDRLEAERKVRELEGRIHRLAVARWTMPRILSGADGPTLVRELARRPATGERLRRREEGRRRSPSRSR